MKEKISKEEGSLTHTPSNLRRARRVFVHDLILSASIGIHVHERTIPQKIRLNVDLALCDDSSSIEDSLEKTVCYEKILQKIRNIVASGHVNLIETLAEHIANVCLEDARVQRSFVKIEKLHTYHDVGSVGVEIEIYNS